MRSSFEVMAAIAMDQMGIKWMYEPKLFKFGRIWYVPDFYLPLEGKWVEVKGRMTKRGRIKIAAFKKAGYKLEIWRQKKLEKLLGMSCSTFVRKYRKGQI